ncbi:glycine cleavage system aminomethyltransferase GcvT [Halococcus hamelinensis]|uniref:Probable aminomethyltransferase n=1 Tax=Halococcus hamelinensis 100A6 TaxID=1132509 RepID=M0M179_9EURY|nr:glycine cleavage system aminomethyltransferase GcvT [Halococcus hamelinensis]EMA39178.1 glycine cleavage system aminomethyltransferase T [Halococcus hamelinensis 100A6]
MDLRDPPLSDEHDASGAKTTEFGGWEMPVEFDSIRTEHAAVRESAGKFDVSHMGQIEVSGPDAAELLNRLTTNDVASLDPGAAQYAMITDSEGVVLDDTVVYRLPAERDADFLFIPNAGHDGEMEDRWVDHRDEWGLEATVENRTTDYAMVAVQGPKAVELVGGAVDDALADLGRFSATATSLDGVEVVVARTGYTGEDGFELLAPWEDATAVWNAFDCQPCGLGARDTLRIEAGFLLSGQDFDPDENPRNPIEAGVSFAVDLDTEFVGRDALAAVAESGPEERFVGFELEARGIPRHGYEISADNEVVGTVTSGTMSPTLSTPLGMGYVPSALADPDTAIAVHVRGEPKDARIRPLPFYQR